MRNVRWAAELAVDVEPSRAFLGLDQLDALSGIPRLDSYELTMVEAALDSLVPSPEHAEEA